MACRCVITKTYKLTHFTDTFRSCLGKSYRNEKLFFSYRTIRIVMHEDVPVASLRRCVKSHCPNISDCIAKADCQYDKSYRHATAPLCHTFPSGQIKSYWHRDVLCVSLGCCVIIGHFRNSCFNFAHERRLEGKV